MMSRAEKQKLDKEAAENSRKIEQNTAGSSRNVNIEKNGKNAAAGSSGYIDTGRNGQNAAGSSKDIEKISKDAAAASAFFDPRYIPIEVWNEVFQYVSIFDLKRLSLSCKSFYQTIGFLPDAMDRIMLNIRETMTAKDQAKLLESSRQYRNIQLIIFNKIGRNKKRNFQKFLEAQAKFIRDLKLFNFPVFASSNTFKLMSNLENLNISTEESEIFNADQDFVCPSVKKLIFYLSDNISEASFLSFIKRFPNIKEVRIVMNVSVNLMKLLADNCPNIKKIAMYNFKFEYFKDPIFNNLAELVIKRVIEFDYQQTFKMEEKSLENLEILKINSGSIEITSASLKCILENLKKLKHLEIACGLKLTKEELCEMSGQFRNLKVFKIQYAAGSLETFKQRLQQFPELHFEYSIFVDSDVEFFNRMDYYGYDSDED